MKLVLKIAGVLLVLLALIAGGGYLWASTTSGRILARTFEVHAVDFPVPFPLSEGETAELGLTDEERDRLALQRAVERGRHLVQARYGCTDCHGADFSGGEMVDAPLIGRLLGPNLTRGQGSRVLNYTAADWDRTVRHGVLPEGRPATMPSNEFRLMSDQELSDIVALIASVPPVDNDVPSPTLGPLGKLLVATRQFPLSADLIGAHDAAHAMLPPAEEASAEFGGHLAATCTGCHGQDLAGGPIVGGDPSWVPARNLTPHPTALESWTYEDFVAAMREGIRPDGTCLQEPMTFVIPYARRMKDVELEAIWLHLRSLPAVPTGE